MKFSEFRRHTPSQASHVYLFVCEDQLLVEESKPIWSRIFGGEWNFEKLSVKEFESLDASELMESALSPPLFGPSRAILVSNAGKLGKRRTEDLARILQLDRSFLKVVLVVESSRSLSRKGTVFPAVEINPLRPLDTMRWLQDRYGVSADVARYIVDNLGTELMFLNGEMEKLTIYLRGTRPAEAADVDQLLIGSDQFGPFELDDAFMAGDYPRAIRVVGAMIDDGVQPILILSKIARLWRQLFIGKVLEKHASPADIARAASAPAWKATTLVAACRRFRLSRLVEGFTELVRADRALKSTSSNPEFYFDVMLWKLMRKES